MSENRLQHETSPYLLQHAANPVHWWAWGPGALAAAREQDKPILLSVGYAACHWCHVMAHESFEDENTAALMNEKYINIKVDREERPDIDAIYQAALALLGQQGGWPLTMFLTPDGEPFWGGTYFPPQPQYGRPGFREVLARIEEIYRTDKATIDNNRKALVQRLGELGETTANDNPLPANIVSQAAPGILERVDRELGGLSGAPKFPNIPLFELLWRAHLQAPQDEYGEAVAHTIERMHEGGIYDHLGGGFARYSVDAHWLVPHFEKMLYDNAALIEIMTYLWQARQTPVLRRRVEETVGWVLREMIADNGAFAATLDADSEGEEGKFYVWDTSEIRDFLGAETDYFCQIYGVREAGNFEGANILNRLHLPVPPDEMEEQRLEPLRALLLKVRGGRVRPGWDDKVLADWNGMMITALTRASQAFDRPDWIDAAHRAFSAICGDLTHKDDAGHTRLWHSYRLGKAQVEGMLDDYAHMARAALALYEATGDAACLDWAGQWVAAANARFWDEAELGYFFTADDAEALIVRTKSASDNATPNGNGIMLEVLAHLYWLTGDEAYAIRADQLVVAFASSIANHPMAYGTFINAFDTLVNGRQIVIVGGRGDPDTQKLLATVSRASLPGRLVHVVEAGAAIPPGHPAHGKDRTGGKPTAYVCQGQTCGLPITDAPALRALLA